MAHSLFLPTPMLTPSGLLLPFRLLGQVLAPSGHQQQREKLEDRRYDDERVQRRCGRGTQKYPQRVRPREAWRTRGTAP